MTFDDFDKSYNSLIEETKKMRDTKGREYSHDADRLANFKRIASALEIDPIVVLYVYMTKHWDSITSFVKGNRENLSEPIRGRIVDLITYAGLMNGLIEEQMGVAPPIYDTESILAISHQVCGHQWDTTNLTCTDLVGHIGRHSTYDNNGLFITWI